MSVSRHCVYVEISGRIYGPLASRYLDRWPFCSYDQKVSPPLLSRVDLETLV